MKDVWVWVPFEVDKKFDGYRVDRFLAQRLAGYTRTKLQKILAECRVMRDGRVMRASAKVRGADKILIAYPRRPEEPLNSDHKVPALFEDDHVLVVDKPAGLLSHPTDKIVEHTVLGYLRHSRKDLANIHLLHRLDRETSGVLALAKTTEAARRWTRAMAAHRIRKEYLALVRGIPKPHSGVIAWPIGRQGGEIKVRQWIDVPDAASAVTHYETVSMGDAFALMKAFPQTGRLHQIRVHFAALGHPLLGDPLYTDEGGLYKKMIAGKLTADERGTLGFPRVALHAASLTFAHPATDQTIVVTSPLPSDIANFLERRRPIKI